MSNYIETKARVTLLLEIDLDGSWSSDTKINQVHRQATDSALGQISKIIKEAKITCRIIGTPQVNAIIVKAT